jgi:L-ascorbate metabolism protein UlaG (beta-lactamase superfamily)
MASASSPSQSPEGVGTIQFVGTATTIIRVGAFSVMTDPNLLHRGQRAYLGHGLSSRRLTEPVYDPDVLAGLDAVVLSHLHGDHFDRQARRQLDRQLPIVTTPHASRRLQGWHGFSRAVGLRTWTSHTLTKAGETLTVTAMPGRHGPGAFQALLPPVMGSMLEFGAADGEVRHRLYISGDTLLYDDLRQIPQRYPEIPTAVLHLGTTTLPGGLVVTMDHRQGCDLIELLDPAHVVPIHLDDYGVFKFDHTAWRDELSRRGLAERVTSLRPGETTALAPLRLAGQ